MATISELYKAEKQPAISRDGNLLTYAEVWYLKLSSAANPVEAEGLLSALSTGNAYSFPVVGSGTHPNNPSLKPTGYSLENADQATNFYVVNLSYTNKIDDINISQRALDAEATYSYQNVDTLIEVDIDPIQNKAIAASNGEAYFPKIQRKGTNKRITINRNERQYIPSRALLYENKMNKTSLKIDGRFYDPRTLILESWTGKSAVDNDGTDYYQVQYQFLYDPNEHKIELIDAASGPDKPNKNRPEIYGFEAGKTYKLNGEGSYMNATDQQDPTKFFPITFYTHEEINMSVLRL